MLFAVEIDDLPPQLGQLIEEGFFDVVPFVKFDVLGRLVRRHGFSLTTQWPPAGIW